MAERIDRINQRFGDYVLQRRLGGGSFGDVYLGEQVHEHSLAAVKVLHIRLTRSEDLRAFINEVRTFRLQHPHIVRMLDVGLAQDETPFLVMAYAPGGTLRDRHPKGSRLSPAQVLGYVLPTASALQYAHDLQLIHRDVKPENLLLGAREALWVSDFGIATVAHSTHSLTAEAMGGTVPYMAPEQLQGRPRPQSDQYALAIVVYEWLTGTWPFRGTAFEIAIQHQMTPPPALRTYRPELAPEVEQVVLVALAKDPKQRFASVLAFARALEQASQTEPTVVEPPSAFLTPDATSGVLQEEQHPPAEEEHVRQAREEKQASQGKQSEPAPTLPVAEATDTNSSQQPTEMATPVLPMPVSQQSVSEVSADIPAQSHTILPLSGRERLPQAEEERRQAEGEKARQEQEQADKLEKERVRKAKETALAVTELATTARQTPLPTEVARASKPATLMWTEQPDAMVEVKPAKPTASRRFVLVGLAGLVIMALVSGITWFTVHHATPTGGIHATPTGGIHATPARTITEFPLPTADSSPQGITAGPDGNLWFTEDNSNKIGSISPSGSITEFNLPTTDSSPQGITAGPDGNLWFTESYDNQIERISPRYTIGISPITAFPLPTADSGPQGITAGPGGNLWFTEANSNKIGRITPAGSITAFPLPTADSGPQGITAGPGGNLWFTEANSNKIGRITPAGSITEFPLPTTCAGSNCRPAGITTGPDGNLWFTEVDSNKIGRITPAGSITAFPLPTTCAGSNCGPDGITAGPDGNLWFTLSFGNSIGRITTGGSFTAFRLPTTCGHELGCRPAGITAGPDGNLWFTESNGNKIGRITSGK